MLAACASPEQLIQDAAEQFVEEQTGVDVDVNEDGGALPDDWPADVPVIPGNIASAASLSAAEGSTWTAQISVDDLKSGFAEAIDLLNAAGFTTEYEAETGGMFTATLSNGSISVTLVSESIAGENTISYLVTTLAQ